jgi:hypothetical protein
VIPGAELSEELSAVVRDETARGLDPLDVCLFPLPTRIPRTLRAALLATFPRAGFHRRLVELGLTWGRRHPLRPLPMLKL